MTFGVGKTNRFGVTVRDEITQMEQEFHEDDLELAYYFIDNNGDDHSYDELLAPLPVDEYDDFFFELGLRTSRA